MASGRRRNRLDVLTMDSTGIRMVYGINWNVFTMNATGRQLTQSGAGSITATVENLARQRLVFSRSGDYGVK